MLNKFWEALGEGVAQKWIQLLGPAFLFWLSGAYLGFGQDGLLKLSAEYIALDVIRQAGLLLVTFLLFVLTSAIISGLSSIGLRTLEGYWPFVPRWLTAWLIGLKRKTMERDINRWQVLKRKIDDEKESESEREEFIKTDVRLHYMPADLQDMMPTDLGNVLRMAERSPFYIYGLDAVVCWPRLWALLPDNLRQDIMKARQSVNQAIEYWIWGMFFLLWILASWWALPISLVACYMFYRMSVSRSKMYADLICTAFDLYRWELYKSLHLPCPNNSADERRLGLQVTEFLWRGTTPLAGWSFANNLQ